MVSVFAIGALFCPVFTSAQVETTDRVVSSVVTTVGWKTPSGPFALGGSVELRRYLIPHLFLGIGGPDGSGLALGNEAGLLRKGRVELRGWAYWSYAFGDVEEDEFSSGYRTTTDPSQSFKLGGSFIIRTNLPLSFALRGGYSWALVVPMITEERPTGTASFLADDPYFHDGPVWGLSMMIRL